MGMQNVVNGQITSIRKSGAKLCKFFWTFCKMFLRQFVLTLDLEKFRTVMFVIAKTRKLFVKNKTSLFWVLKLYGMIKKWYMYLD